MIADVLLNEAIAIVAVDHWAGACPRSQFAAAAVPRHLAAEVAILSGRPNGPVGIEEPVAKPIQRRAARSKTRLSQNSTWEKNSRCWHPTLSRSRTVKNGVSRV
jgi:hypothetical protein